MSEASDRWTVNLDGALLQDRFEVERMIGGGGMANVYRAHDRQLDIPVVVKIPHAAFLAEPGFRERFDRETRDLVTLQHPHIVRVLARGEHEGLPFLVMQFLQGGSLGDRIRKLKGEQLPFDEVRTWVRDVARALDFIHGQGIVHRDIKPDNVLFDEHGHAYLSDFGIAKAVGGVDTGLTVTGATPGSPAYMAPEQPRSKSLTGASDQYSLAATLYEALSGRPTFEGETVVDVLMKKQTDLPEPLASVAPKVPQPAADALMRALSPAPEDRFATCEAMVEAMLSTPTPPSRPAHAELVQPPLRGSRPAAPRHEAHAGASAPAHTESVGSTSTFGGGTKVMWVLLAVLLLGGPAAMLMFGDSEPGPEAGTDVADQGAAPEDEGDPWDTKAVHVLVGSTPAEVFKRVGGTWVVDRDAIRARLKEAEGNPRIARMLRRHRRELELAMKQDRELVVSSDGTFRLTMPPPDGRPALPVSGRWTFDAGTLRLVPDAASAPKALKHPLVPFTATLHENRLVLRRPGPGGGTGLPLVRRP